MEQAMGVVTYGLGTVLGVVLTLLLVYWFLQDITQKKHTVLRNFPVIGRLRYVLEKQGEKGPSTSEAEVLRAVIEGDADRGLGGGAGGGAGDEGAGGRPNPRCRTPSRPAS